MMKKKPIYLDYNATTPCSSEVFHAMIPFFEIAFANPSSPHLMGREAARAVEIARNNIADSIGVSSEDVFFTSGATESNNIVFRGLAERTHTRHRIYDYRNIYHQSPEERKMRSDAQKLRWKKQRESLEL